VTPRRKKLKCVLGGGGGKVEMIGLANDPIMPWGSPLVSQGMADRVGGIEEQLEGNRLRQKPSPPHQSVLFRRIISAMGQGTRRRGIPVRCARFRPRSTQQGVVSRGNLGVAWAG